MSEPAVTKVSIDTPPLTVTVEAPDISVDDAAAGALALYRLVWEPSMRGTHMGGVGFSAERSGD